jgi:hypothetical protein
MVAGGLVYGLLWAKLGPAHLTPQLVALELVGLLLGYLIGRLPNLVLALTRHHFAQ